MRDLPEKAYRLWRTTVLITPLAERCRGTSRKGTGSLVEMALWRIWLRSVLQAWCRIVPSTSVASCTEQNFDVADYGLNYATEQSHDYGGLRLRPERTL